ncbi:hypothetical protein [Moraxella lacunata]|uniref:hypothetical protein n=1 Tax=Moraxella lacunata TaxID=477 RepID=UPI003EDF808C
MLLFLLPPKQLTNHDLIKTLFSKLFSKRVMFMALFLFVYCWQWACKSKNLPYKLIKQPINH